MSRGSNPVTKEPLRPLPSVGSVSSTDAQNNFGQVLSRAMLDGMVFITKYGADAAVVLSIERFRALVPSKGPDLVALTQEFDDLVARMQTPEARAGADSLFSMSPDELAEAAVQASQPEVA